MTAEIVTREGAVIERHIQRHDGLDLVVWIIRPDGPGPFPMLVVNHGSNIVQQADGSLGGDVRRPTVDPSHAPWFSLAQTGWLHLFPEGRGYGGSDGPNPLGEIGSPSSTMAMLAARAGDANAATDWACARPDVDSTRVAIAGASHGGVVTLLAAAIRPYAAAVPQATGASYGHTEFGAVMLANAAARIRAPVLFQHMRSDTLVPMAGARAIYEWSSRFRPAQQWRDYPGVPGLEGHMMFLAAHWAQWHPDYMRFLNQAFASPGPMPAPRDAAEQLTDEALPFGLPGDVAPLAQRWHGWFGAAPDGVETLLVLEGDTAVYAWKEGGSRGYQRTPLIRRGSELVLMPWPDVTITYTRTADGMLEALFTNRHGTFHGQFAPCP